MDNTLLCRYHLLSVGVTLMRTKIRIKPEESSWLFFFAGEWRNLIVNIKANALKGQAYFLDIFYFFT